MVKAIFKIQISDNENQTVSVLNPYLFGFHIITEDKFTKFKG